MKKNTLRQHIVTAVLILVMSFGLFTLIPSLFPHPEDFSPYAYAVAFLASVEIWLLIKNSKRKWFLLPVLILCLLALLDETGYGSEVLNIPPIYSQSLHTEIRDLHNLIGIAMDITNQTLEEAHWNGSLFIVLLAFDVLVLICGLLFGWLFRFRLPAANELRHQRIIWLASGSWLSCGIITAIYLLSLPPDPTNAFLLGYSPTRVLSILLVLIFSCIPTYLLTRTKGFSSRVFVAWFTKHGNLINIVCVLIILMGIAYQLYSPFAFLPDEQTRLERVTPLVLWFMALAWFAFLGARAMRGGLREPVSKLFGQFADFLRREPAYFYSCGAILLILVAQLIDQDVIPLNTLIQTPNFHINLWGLWTEETFEMVGAFLFITAACYYPESK